MINYSSDTWLPAILVETAVPSTSLCKQFGLIVGRASWLDDFNYNSNFSADDRNINDDDRLRGVRLVVPEGDSVLNL